jgi:hypothetical protein
MKNPAVKSNPRISSVVMKWQVLQRVSGIAVKSPFVTRVFTIIPLHGKSGFSTWGISRLTYSHITHNIIDSSTISHNRASKYGGGIVNWGEMIVHSSSIIHNDVCSTVGGIMNIRTGNLTTENSIIAENTVVRYRPGR